MTKPNFFIVGSARCGTTSMYEYLKKHPNIFMPKVKEPGYFGDDFRTRGPKRSIEEYLRLFDDAENKDRVGEASISYLISEKAPYEIHNLQNNAKIIIMLRDPVEKMHSLYNKLLKHGIETAETFGHAIDLEKDRKKGYKLPERCNDKKTLLYKFRCKYYEKVKRYVNVFGRKNVKSVIFERFTEKTPRVYKETLKFLEVDHTYLPKTFDPKNQNKKVHSTLLRDTIKQILNTKVAGVIKSCVDTRTRKNFRKVIDFVNTEKTRRSPIEKKLEYELRKEFENDVKKLSKLIDKDLSRWYKV